MKENILCLLIGLLIGTVMMLCYILLMDLADLTYLRMLYRAGVLLR